MLLTPVGAPLAHLDINTMNIAGLGSGTAFPAILSTTGANTADIGEMSRPPTQGEWTQTNAGTAQIWAVGVDSLAIVYSQDMTWAPTDLTAKQVCQLFESTDAAGASPIYTTWGQFFTAYTAAGGTLPAGAAAHANDPINRIVRDPTSGTYDCFDNFFGKQLSNDAEAKNSAGAVTGSQYMAPYTLAVGNPDVVTDIQSATDSIAFISLGYYLTNTAIMIPINIYNNNAGVTAGYYAPSQANVIAGTYTPFRWLWEATPNTIPTTGPNLAEGVWIAYMKLDAGIVNGNPNFVTDNAYMAMPRAAMAGGAVENSALATYTPTSGQTQTVPRLVVDANDFFYFMDAYIAYYAQHVYNPYADVTAQGSINGGSFLAFMADYVYYYTTYAPNPTA